eukprot:763213-Ditylum_brightwellii.AAC.1
MSLAGGDRGGPPAASKKGNPLCLRCGGNGGMWSRSVVIGSLCRDQMRDPCHEQHVDGLRRRRGLGYPLSRRA